MFNQDYPSFPPARTARVLGIQFTKKGLAVDWIVLLGFSWNGLITLCCYVSVLQDLVWPPSDSPLHSPSLAVHPRHYCSEGLPRPTPAPPTWTASRRTEDCCVAAFNLTKMKSFMVRWRRTPLITCQTVSASQRGLSWPGENTNLRCDTQHQTL